MEDVQMKNKYISAFAIVVSFGLLVGCFNKTDDVISDNVQTQSVESSESVVETVETASQNESAETAESTPTTESVEVSKEDEELNEVVSDQNEVVQEQTTVEDTTDEEVIEDETTEAEPTEQTTQPTQQSTSTSSKDIDRDHLHWCEQNDLSQLTEDEANYLMAKFPGLPKDPRQMTVAEYTAYMEAYWSSYYDTYSDATDTTPEDTEITEEDVAAAFAARGIGVTSASADVDTSALDGWEIVWD